MVGCCLPCEDPDDVTYTFSIVVLQQDMDMVLVCLHSDDVPMIMFGKIMDGFLNELVYAVLKQSFPIFGDQYDMGFQVILTTILTVIVLSFFLSVL